VSNAQKDIEGATSGSAAANDGVKADFANIPLPPESAEGEAQAIAEASAEDRSRRAKEDVAILEFEEPAGMVNELPLKHPFRWKGEWLRTVSIRRLTFAEAMRVTEEAQKTGRELSNFDLFAAMTGLTAPVIRGMEAGDGDRVTNACLPFLPLTEEDRASP
jgi:hypothetical protein